VQNGRAPEISITLSPEQVREVLRAAASNGCESLAARIARELQSPIGGGGRDRLAVASTYGADAARPARAGAGRDEERRLSRSLLRGLAMLACFTTPPGERGVVELAAELGVSPSTAHRYAQTLLELGLIERSPLGRKYRLPQAR
jgi:hypothetical protein